ncbi:MAG: AAA family ATPase [Melioribacteraceae bacterium]|jgi:exonuclease SbcC|nr:AAA family ATPase [Melioribacteraceae bacterium]
MLKELRIKNIQCYDKMKVEFSPGLNVIIGDSGKGKTTLFRAITWPFNNLPEGVEFKEQFIRHGEKEASSELIFDDCSIKRIKSNKVNSYFINDQELKAPGRKVPEEVINKLRLHDINFQAFTEPNFLFAQKDTEVSRYLNKIADLENIDSSVSSIKKEKREIDIQIKEIKKELLDKKEKLKTYEWLTDAEPLITHAEHLEDNIKRKQARISSVKDKLERIAELKKQLSVSIIPSGVKEQIEEIEKRNNSFNKKETINKKIVNILDQLKSKYSIFRKLDNEVMHMKKKFKKLMPKICPLCNKEV